METRAIDWDPRLARTLFPPRQADGLCMGACMVVNELVRYGWDPRKREQGQSQREALAEAKGRGRRGRPKGEGSVGRVGGNKPSNTVVPGTGSDLSKLKGGCITMQCLF